MTISRKEILDCDFRRILAVFSLENDPDLLRPLLGRVTLAICDFDDIDDELFEIPQVRSYFGALNCHYPYWLAVSTIQSHALRLIAACVADNLDATRAKGNHFCTLRLRRGEVESFYMNAIPFATAIQRAAMIPPWVGTKRMRAVTRHLAVF